MEVPVVMHETMTRRDFLRLMANPRLTAAREYLAAYHRGEVPGLTDYEYSLKFGVSLETLFAAASTPWWQAAQRVYR